MWRKLFKPPAAHQPAAAPALRTAEWPQLLNIEVVDRVLILAPHPDDEVIGCGGLIAKLCRAGKQVDVVLVTNGDGGGELPPGTAEARQAEMCEALRRLGARPPHLLNHPDGRFQDGPLFQQQLQQLLDQTHPQWVLIPPPHDPHPDHHRLAHACHEQLSTFAGIEQIGFYEIWAPVIATHALDIREVATEKWNALEAHTTALKYGNYLNGCKGLALYRGLLIPAPSTPENPVLGEAFAFFKPSSLNSAFAGFAIESNSSQNQ